MKWCFLLNNASYLGEFLGKITHQAIKKGDECIVLINSKIVEYEKKKYFPQQAKFISRVDWCIKNYKKEQEKFNDLSWKEFFPSFDRKTQLKLFNFDYNNSVEIISQLYQFFDAIIQKEKPDVIINEFPANVFTGIAYFLAKKHNVLYLGLIGSRFDKRIDIYDLEYTYSKYKETFDELLYQDISLSEKKFAKDFINDFVSHKRLPSGTDNPVLYFQKINLTKYYTKRLKQVYQPRFYYFLNRKQFKPFDYESEAILKSSLRAPLNAVQRKLRSIFQKNIFEFINDKDKYFLFPLHFQPEASTSALATYFCDQLSTIRNIAFSLPFPYKLYVKEHPAAIGTRPIDFYRELKRIPNVVLISPEENVGLLIKNSLGVITLTSTIGLEAILIGKPVYVLGNVFYSYHLLCRKVNSFEELKKKIETDLANKPAVTNLEEINIRFIISYFKNTIPGDIIAASSDNDTNDYEKIYSALKEHFLERS